MYSTLLFLSASLATLSTTAPISLADAQTQPSSYPIRSQTPEDIAVIDRLGFRNSPASNTADTVCAASDIACVMGKPVSSSAMPTPTPLPVDGAAAAVKPVAISKRDAQTMSLGDAIAAAGISGSAPKPENASATVKLCAASDIECIVKRNEQLKIADGVAEKKRRSLEQRDPQAQTIGEATNNAGIHGQDAAASSIPTPSTPPAQCAASDIDCIVGRSIEERDAQAQTLGEATNNAGINGQGAAVSPVPTPPTPPAQCAASDIDCVVGRSIQERDAQAQTIGEATNAAGINGQEAAEDPAASQPAAPPVQCKASDIDCVVG